MWKIVIFYTQFRMLKNLFVFIFHEGKQDNCKKTRYFVQVSVDTTFFLLGKISFLIYCSVYWFFLSISCPLHEKKFCLEIDFPKWFLALIAWFFRKSKRLAMLFICSIVYFWLIAKLNIALHNLSTLKWAKLLFILTLALIINHTNILIFCYVCDQSKVSQNIIW